MEVTQNDYLYREYDLIIKEKYKSITSLLQVYAQWSRQVPKNNNSLLADYNNIVHSCVNW